MALSANLKFYGVAFALNYNGYPPAVTAALLALLKSALSATSTSLRLLWAEKEALKGKKPVVRTRDLSDSEKKTHTDGNKD